MEIGLGDTDCKRDSKFSISVLILVLVEIGLGVISIDVSEDDYNKMS